MPSQSTTLEAEPTNAPARRRWTSSRVRIELLGAAISAALALAGVTAVLRLWKAHLNIPIASGGDVSHEVTEQAGRSTLTIEQTDAGALTATGLAVNLLDRPQLEPVGS